MPPAAQSPLSLSPSHPITAPPSSSSPALRPSSSSPLPQSLSSPLTNRTSSSVPTSSSAVVFRYPPSSISGPNSKSSASSKNGKLLSGSSRRVSSSSVQPTHRSEGEILQSSNLKSFTFSELRSATRNFRPDSVLGEGGTFDIALTKSGGDLIKWDKAKIGYYVGVDIAEGSVKDCRTRYNGDADQQARRKKFSFPARLICADCYEMPCLAASGGAR